MGVGVALVGVGTLGASAFDGSTMAGYHHGSSVIEAAQSRVANVSHLIGIGDEESLAPGTLDDGKDLLPQAKISLEQAIANAQAAVPGKLAEVDLEHYQGKLVFNVDSGGQDIKVDATTGEVLGAFVG
jgi:uncharacterized membrane protein YkoI